MKITLYVRTVYTYRGDILYENSRVYMNIAEYI
jgi:hypothetical protein